MPEPYPQEFRDQIMGRDKNTTIAQIAKDFGVHEVTITKWIGQAEIDAGNKPAHSTDESAELRILRSAAAYPSKANLPPKGSAGS